MYSYLSIGFNHASIEGLAVLNRFQSNLENSIFREIGVFGGAAKLNQDVFNSTDPEAVECFPPKIKGVNKDEKYYNTVHAVNDHLLEKTTLSKMN